MTSDEFLQNELLIGGIVELHESGPNIFRGMIQGLSRDENAGIIIVIVDDLKKFVNGGWRSTGSRVVNFPESSLQNEADFKNGVLQLSVPYLGSIILFLKGTFSPTSVPSNL